MVLRVIELRLAIWRPELQCCIRLDYWMLGKSRLLSTVARSQAFFVALAVWAVTVRVRHCWHVRCKCIRATERSGIFNTQTIVMKLYPTQTRSTMCSRPTKRSPRSQPALDRKHSHFTYRQPPSNNALHVMVECCLSLSRPTGLPGHA